MVLATSGIEVEIFILFDTFLSSKISQDNIKLRAWTMIYIDNFLLAMITYRYPNLWFYPAASARWHVLMSFPYTEISIYTNLKCGSAVQIKNGWIYTAPRKQSM